MIQNEDLKKLAVQVFGMTGEDMAKVTPELEAELLSLASKGERYKLILEVVSSKYCFAGLQPGQKYVIEKGQQFSPIESTAPSVLALSCHWRKRPRF